MSTVVPVHQYTGSVYLFFFGITCTITFQLIYTQIYLKLFLPVYLHVSLLSKHKALPVTTTTSVPAHRCTRSGPYLFIFILSFRLTAKIYPSTFLLLYMSTDVPVHQYTCSIYFFLFRLKMHNYPSTQLLGCVHTDLPENKFTCLSSCSSFA